jgi:hypothetical protein
MYGLGMGCLAARLLDKSIELQKKYWTAESPWARLDSSKTSILSHSL